MTFDVSAALLFTYFFYLYFMLIVYGSVAKFTQSLNFLVDQYVGTSNYYVHTYIYTYMQTYT